ncbi:hypothetical protein E2562_031927 [Oryza meyeriana var. granulata]|uniref:Uncharacterized protein n=1 Tax=Oryza meyeriana var. granulata TaxID=110450 RepID=A0A6G1DRV0_9ORYZ|nr:hypothetical protein E2562_031927 [Oryza meyeriana var. granulata]
MCCAVPYVTNRSGHKARDFPSFADISMTSAPQDLRHRHCLEEAPARARNPIHRRPDAVPELLPELREERHRSSPNPLISNSTRRCLSTISYLLPPTPTPPEAPPVPGASERRRRARSVGTVSSPPRLAMRPKALLSSPPLAPASYACQF